jgi:predicted ABC-type ATPase
LIYLWLRAVELAIERVHERVRGGGHDVPDEVVRRRYAKGVRNFFDLSQGLADTWGIYDNSSPGNPRPIAIKNKESPDEILQWELWEQFCEVAKWA